MVITCTTKFTLNNCSHFPPESIYLFCVDIGGGGGRQFPYPEFCDNESVYCAVGTGSSDITEVSLQFSIPCIIMLAYTFELYQPNLQFLNGTYINLLAPGFYI
jgi:hypothetical protein